MLLVWIALGIVLLIAIDVTGDCDTIGSGMILPIENVQGPSDTSVLENKNVTFSCYPKTGTVSWLLNCLEATESAMVVITQNNITLLDVTRDKTGLKVTCRVLSDDSIVYEESAILRVYFEPEVNITQTSPLEVNLGDSITLTCTVNSSPPPHVQWVGPGGSVLLTNETIDAPLSLNLTLSNVSSANSGEYVCIGTSNGVSKNSSITIRVIDDDEGSDFPISMTIFIVLVAGGGLLFLLILILCIAISLFCCLRKRREKPLSPLVEQHKSSFSNSTRGGSIRISLRKSKPFDPIDEFRKNTRTQEMESHPPIPRDSFLNHLGIMRMNDNQLFMEEFGSIQMVPDYPRECCQLPHNIEKNRYDNILPYDHSRVKLPNIRWQEGSDYINASYLDGFMKPKAYIATQGPIPSTIGDFWRLVWEENSRTIVMVTNVKEKSQVKCETYWPIEMNLPSSYGGIEVTLVETVKLADFTIRSFSILKGGSQKDARDVKQFHFTSWPDKGVPDFPTALLAMVRAVRAHHHQQTNTGPMVVHCSAGVGRTGTFVVINSMLSRVLSGDEYIDIYGYVTLLRNMRNYMVQTEDQYFFIHEAIAEAIACGVTDVTADKFPSYLDKLELIQEDGESSLLELEFKRLLTDRTEPHRFASATRNVNKGKNRFVNIMPYEYNRVKLSFIRATEGSDYINASYVDSYRQQRAFIATQGPLRNTVADFWRMVWEHQSPVIVMLTLVEERQQECSATLWSDGGKKRYGDMSVEVLRSRDDEDYDYKEFTLTHAQVPETSHIVKFFQFFGWPERGVPESALPLLDFIQEIRRLYITLQTDKPIIVMCSSGVGRTGVFITLDIILERLAVEGLIDVFQTIKMLRIQRSAMVQTLEQYHFCYVSVLDYLLHHGYLNQRNARSASIERRSSVKAVHSKPSLHEKQGSDRNPVDSSNNIQTTTTF